MKVLVTIIKIVFKSIGVVACLLAMVAIGMMAYRAA
jgi:hypothetical protein